MSQSESSGSDKHCRGFLPGSDPARCVWCGAKIDGHPAASTLTALDRKVIQYGFFRQQQRMEEAEEAFRAIQADVAAKQAEIDRLMLEYCPEEMSAEQTAEWGKHQIPAPSAEQDTVPREDYLRRHDDAVRRWEALGNIKLMVKRLNPEAGQAGAFAEIIALCTRAMMPAPHPDFAPSSELARFTGDDQLLADLDSAFITDDLAPQALKDLCRLASVALADANYWRARHCRESEAAGKQSHEHWQKWKDAEARLAAVSHEQTRDPLPKAFAQMPRGVLTRLLERDLHPADFMFLAALLDELTRTTGTPIAASATRRSE
jgi:hypothetical protein